MIRDALMFDEVLEDAAFLAQQDQESAEFDDVAERAARLYRALRKQALPIRTCSDIVVGWVAQCFAPFELDFGWEDDE